MRIEHIGTTKNIPENARSQGLAQGEILIAEVTGVDGEKVILKSQDGMTLTANLLNDINVSVGDFVETVVDVAGHGRYVLRIVDITRNLINNNAGETYMPAMHADTSAVRTLRDTLNIMKMNPGTGPKLAAFLSRHDINGTPENIEVMTQLSKTEESVGRLLTEVKSLVMQGAETKAEDTLVNTADSAANTIQNADSYKSADTSETTENTNENEKMVSTPKTATTDAENKSIHNLNNNALEKNAPSSDKLSTTGHSAYVKPTDNLNGAFQAEQTVGLKLGSKLPGQPENALDSAVQKETGAVSSFSTPADAATKTAEHIDTVNTAPDNLGAGLFSKDINAGVAGHAAAGLDLNAALKLKADTNAPGLVTEENEAQTAAQTVQMLSEKIASLFVKLSDKDKLAENIKRAVTELPEQIKELKLLLVRNDTNNKDALMRKLEPAEKQLALMSQIKRFDCFHIPLLRTDGSDTTAELYVYRNRKKRKAEDDEKFVIMLGLDTQYLGRVETLIKASGNGLSITLHMEDTRIANEIADDIKLLKNAAEQFGYAAVNISIEKLISQTTILNAEERLTMQPGTGPGVDIRI